MPASPTLEVDGRAATVSMRRTASTPRESKGMNRTQAADTRFWPIQHQYAAHTVDGQVHHERLGGDVATDGLMGHRFAVRQDSIGGRC